MSPRVSRVVAAAFAGVCLLTGTGLALMDLLMPATSGGGPVVPIEVIPVALFLWGTPLLGLLVAVRRPENPVGWLLMVTAFGWALSFGVDDLAHRAPSPVLAGPLEIAQQVSAVGFLGLILLLVFFPTGTLPSKRWRVLPVAAVAGSAAGAVAGLFAPGSVVDDPPVPELANPFGQPGWGPLLELLGTFGQLAFVVAVVGSIAVLVIRARGSNGTERQQLKWFASAGGLCALLFVAALVVGTVAPDSVVGTALWALGLSSLFLIPLSAAVAILRYRLYEIDRILSRTISYAIVTAVLGAVFWAAVLVLQSALAPVTGSDTLTVAGSTLLVAGLFQPVRRRIRGVVDGRFNRRRYDAERELEAFVARARDEVEIARLADVLASTLIRTVEPTSAAVWLRSGPEARNEVRTMGA